MISIRLTFALVYVSAAIACTPTTEPSPIDSVLESGIANGRIPGVIAVAANSEGTIYQGVFGKRDISRDADMTIDTIMQIASMTKAITSVAVLQLFQQGKLRLDQPAYEYLPELANVQVLEGFDADDKPILRAPRTPVTVRQLLTHTSGYVYEFWNANAVRYAQLGEVASILDGGDGFLAAPLAFDPGTGWEYGISTDILGVLIEVVSGQTLDAYFREHIFDPLEMPDTHFNLPDDKLSRLATLYAKTAEGELIPLPVPDFDDHFYSGGGGLSSTANDYIRFLRALLNDGELDGARILKAETVDLMAQNHIGEHEAARSVVSQIPEFSNDFDFMPESVDKFGLGFLINSDPVPRGRSAGSLTWGGLFNTYFWIDRDRDICGVVMTQILPFWDADVIHLWTQFETAVYSSINMAENL